MRLERHGGFNTPTVELSEQLPSISQRVRAHVLDAVKEAHGEAPQGGPVGDWLTSCGRPVAYLWLSGATHGREGALGGGPEKAGSFRCPWLPVRRYVPEGAAVLNALPGARGTCMT